MARGINKVILIGNLGADPEVRYTSGGSAVSTVSVATTESWKDRQSGEQREQTEWHRVVFFDRRAEVAGEYLKKGSRIYVEGRLQTRKWQDKDGNDRYTTEIRALDMQMLGGSDGGGGGGFNQSAPPASKASSGGGAAPASPPADDFDDDIPF